MREAQEVESWIRQAQAGELSWSAVAERILAREHPVGSAHQPDVDRARRCGFGEVIFGEHKTAEAIASIALRLLQSGQSEVLITRCAADNLTYLTSRFEHLRYDSGGRTLRLSRRPIQSVDNSEPTAVVAVVTAGSTDLNVAREAIETLGWMKVPARLIQDVGVAGPYRLLPHLNLLRDATAIVVCAGMEGALASVMGGMVACPVIAVPTSVGYGANFAGVTTLLSMMSSCAAGVTVVNIDAGFKGGYVAGLIASRRTRL